jgi:hypothetical protein
VLARYVHNDRLIDTLMAQAFAALNVSPGARAFYDQQRAGGAGYNDSLRRLANQLAGHPAPMPGRPAPLRQGHGMVPSRRNTRRLTI